MKKVVSIFLCTLFLFNIMGYYIVITLLREGLREEMKCNISSDINKNEVQKLIFPIASFHSLVKFTDDEEFIFNGELYDIVKTENSGKNIVVYCINDKKEEQLMAFAKDHYSRNNDQTTPSKDKSSQIIKNIIKDALPDGHEFSQAYGSNNIVHFIYNPNTHHSYITVLSPPPKA